MTKILNSIIWFITYFTMVSDEKAIMKHRPSATFTSDYIRPAFTLRIITLILTFIFAIYMNPTIEVSNLLIIEGIGATIYLLCMTRIHKALNLIGFFLHSILLGWILGGFLSPIFWNLIKSVFNL